jgi:hypothetical protein
LDQLRMSGDKPEPGAIERPGSEWALKDAR